MMTLLLTLLLFLNLALSLPTTLPLPNNKTALLARQTTPLTLSAYTSPSCTGTMFAYDALYSSNTEAQIKSYKLSRALLANEQLDFSTPPVGNPNDCGDMPCPCGLFYQSAPGEEGTGCRTLESDSVGCFRLWVRERMDAVEEEIVEFDGYLGG